MIRSVETLCGVINVVWTRFLFIAFTVTGYRQIYDSGHSGVRRRTQELAGTRGVYSCRPECVNPVPTYMLEFLSDFSSSL